jgi:hypothetical protein
MAQYPNPQKVAYEFSKCEIDLDGEIFSEGISNVSHDQPIEEGVAHGAGSPEPQSRTEGQLSIGNGNLEWSDLGRAQQFIDKLGDGFQVNTFNATLTYTARGRPDIKRELLDCRLLNVEEDHAAGTDPLGSVMPFSFMSRTLNGKKPIASNPA